MVESIHPGWEYLQGSSWKTIRHVTLPVCLSAEQVIRVYGGRGFLWWQIVSFLCSQQVHDEVWACQVWPAFIINKRHRPASNCLHHTSAHSSYKSQKAVAMESCKTQTEALNPWISTEQVPIREKPRGQLLSCSPWLHLTCQCLIWYRRSEYVAFLTGIS